MHFDQFQHGSMVSTEYFQNSIIGTFNRMFGEVSNEVEYFPGAVTNIQNIQYNSFLNGIFEENTRRTFTYFRSTL